MAKIKKEKKKVKPQAPVEPESKPLPAARNSDDPIPRKVRVSPTVSTSTLLPFPRF